MDKSINYLSRDFNTIKDELIKFSKLYYPEISDTFNDSSVGSWLIDLMSAVGDDLNYHIDRMYQETTLDGANMRSSLFSIARNNNVKIPTQRASFAEIEVTCVLPTDDDDISKPRWDLSPILKMDSIVGGGGIPFSLTEDINFAEQFNSEGYSNRKFMPNRSSNGIITSYTVSKSSVCTSAIRKVYKHIITENELQPFMEIVLPEQNIMNIEGVIFKETSDLNIIPQMYEYYMENEQFFAIKEDIKTYKYFEVNSLVDQYRFGDMSTVIDEVQLENMFKPSVYEDYNEVKTDDDGNIVGSRISRYYKGKWKPITQKYITEVTNNGYLKLIFGNSNAFNEPLTSGDRFNESVISKVINNDMLGVLPRVGWTMYVLYNVGGGEESNLGNNSINEITLKDVTFATQTGVNASASTKSEIINSLRVTNITPSIGGKNMPNEKEMKYIIKYNTSAQSRCVTLKDYKSRLLALPSKYGSPFRFNVAEENNKIEVPCLTVDMDGKLSTFLPQIIVDNMVEYLTHYKSLGDYIEFKSGRIYNLGFSVDLFIDKNYTASDVVFNVINVIKEYFNINNHDMGDEIFVGDLEKEINMIDGVLNLVDFHVYNIYSGDYGSKTPYKERLDYSQGCEPSVGSLFTTPNGSFSYEIDLSSIDYTLGADYDSMFEILHPENDIVCKFQLK